MKINIKKKILLHLPYLFIFYFASKFSQTYFLIFDGNIVTSFMQAINLVFKIIPLYPFPSFSSKDLSIGIMTAGIFRLILYIKSRNPKKYRKGIEYGSARWSA